MKICSVCGIAKDCGQFRKGKICRACETAKAREYRKTEAYHLVKRRYQQSLKGKKTARCREERLDVKEKRRLFSVSAQGRKNKAKYEASEKAKIVHKRAIAKYLQTEKGRNNQRLRDLRRSQNPIRQAKMAGYHKTYHRTEKGRIVRAKRNAQRYAWVVQTDHPLTAAQWLQVLKANRYRCYYCKEKGKLTIDHVTPLSKGGQHTMENVVPACQSCNSRKYDKIVMLL